MAHALTRSHRLGLRWGPPGDVDLCVHSCSAAEATDLAKTIFDCVAADAESWSVTRGCGVITLQEHEKHGATMTEYYNRRSVGASMRSVLHIPPFSTT